MVYRFHREERCDAWHVQVFARTLGAPVDPRNLDSCRQQSEEHRRRRRWQRTGPISAAPSLRGTWYTKDQQDPVAVFRAPK